MKYRVHVPPLVTLACHHSSQQLTVKGIPALGDRSMPHALYKMALYAYVQKCNVDMSSVIKYYQLTCRGRDINPSAIEYKCMDQELCTIVLFHPYPNVLDNDTLRIVERAGARIRFSVPHQTFLAAVDAFLASEASQEMKLLGANAWLRTPLPRAVADYLMSVTGAQLNKQDAHYVVHAAGCGLVKEVHDALISGYTGDVRELLIAAIDADDIEMVEMILKHAGEQEPISCAVPAMCEVLHRNNMLDIRASWEEVDDVIKARWLVVHAKSEIELSEASLITSRNGHYLVVKYLIEELHVAVPRDLLVKMCHNYPRPELIDLLIANGAGVNTIDDDGNTIAHLAPLCVRLFLDYGLHLSSLLLVNTHGNTVLHVAVSHGMESEMIRCLCAPPYCLIKRINYRNVNGCTPLHFAYNYMRHPDAVYFRNQQIVIDTLLSLGADPCIIDVRGKTPDVSSHHGDDVGVTGTLRVHTGSADDTDSSAE